MTGPDPDPRTTYDRIADHFAATREYPWPEIESFVADADRVALALDVGCGNGRHAEVLAKRADRVVALDASRGLLLTARDRRADHGFDADLVQGDAAALPLRDGRVGLAVYVATLHHLRPRERRVASLDELARVLAPGGRALVGVWSTTHDRFDAEAGFDTTVDWTLPGGETVPRYYHIYDPAEFDDDLAASPLAVHERFESSGNCYAVVGVSRSGSRDAQT
jgi:ubiquinone/menaquinone biosynthesis C-methylase UbiE